jgi:DNA-binding MarR family transcriptional regulator
VKPDTRASELRNLLFDVARMVRLQEKEVIGFCGMTPQQAYTLHRLSKTPGIAMQDLSTVTGVTVSTISRNVDKLERAGLVSKEKNGSDGREVSLYLTELGSERVEQLRLSYYRFVEQIASKLDDGEATTMIEGLRILLRVCREN